MKSLTHAAQMPWPGLNIGAELATSRANGPGVRYTIWLQGCPILCKGCRNTELQPFHIHNWVTIDELAERIVSQNGVEGVTYTGGEPFVQAEGLFHLSVQLRRYHLGIVCYSGYTRKQLEALEDPFVARLLSQLDLLIDGPFLEEQKAAIPWRGSRNQQVHFLTERYLEYRCTIDQPKVSMEFFIGEGTMTLTGFWEQDFERQLMAVIEED